MIFLKMIFSWFCDLCSCIFAWLALAYIIFKVFDHFLRKPKLVGHAYRYILVTGCDTGFGNGIAKRLDRLGCHVFAACLTATGEEDLKKVCSPRLKPIHLDVSDHDSVLQAHQFVTEHLPQGRGLWAVLNNAGIIGSIGSSDWLSIMDYQNCHNVNLYGLIDVTTTFLSLVKLERGRVVNTASIMGRLSFPGSPPYCTSKYGVEAFSDILRREMYHFGVTVHIIEPGLYKTNVIDKQAMERSVRKSWEGAPDDVKDQYGVQYMEDAVKYITSDQTQKHANLNLNDVIDAYEHALLGKYPRSRYVVGTDAKFILLPLTQLPAFMADWVLRKLNSLTSYPKPAARVRD